MSDFLPPVVLHLTADISEYTAKLAAAAAQLEEFTRGAGEHVEAATKTIGEEGHRAGEKYSTGLGTHATEAAEGLVRDVSGRLRDARGRFVKEGEEHGKAVAEGFLGGLRAFMSSLWSELSTLASQIGNILGTAGKIAAGAFSVLTMVAFPALIAAALQAVPALSTVATALAASIPAGAMAATGALGALMLGFHGLIGAIGAAFTPAAGGAASAMNQVANAEWNLKQAQQQSIATQLALNQARVAAVQNIKDLALAMSGAKLHVEEAELAVKDADRAWRVAFASGNQDQIYRTNLALRQAQQNLADAQNSADKTAAQKDDADKRGVEGSQGVQAALQAQENAAHALEQAQQALTQAMKGSGGAASALATAMAKLAPAARAVVEEIIKLKPALHDIQQTVQEHMFVGLASDLDHLAHNILPAAKTGLTGIADQFNLLFRGIAQGMSTPAFTGALTTVLGSFSKVLGEFAGLAGKGIQAFANLAAAATPFMQKIGEGAAGGLGKFLDWINKLASNGSLQKFFSTAIELLTPLAGLFKDVGSIVGSLLQAISGGGGPALGVLGTLIHQLAEFFKSADGMKALTGLFAAINPILNLLGSTIAALLPPLGKILDALGGALGKAITALIPPFLKLVDAVTPLIVTIGDALVPILDALAPALGSIIDAAAPLVALLGGALGQVLTAMAPVIAQVATVIGQILTQALIALTPIFEKLLPVIAQLTIALLPILVPLIQLVAKVFAALMPILTPLISLLVDILAPILTALMPILTALAAAIGLVVDALVWVITPIADFIAWLVKGLTQASTWQAIGHWFMDLWRSISDAFESGVHWVSKKWDEFIGFVTGLPKRVTSALGDFNTLLWDKGRDLIMGLWRGIESMGAWIGRQVTQFVKDFIPAPIAKVLGINSPSKVAAELGQWVPIGLAQGMEDSMHHVTAASGRLATAMVPSVGAIQGGIGGLPTMPGGLTAAPGGHSEPASLPPIQLTIPIQVGGRTMEVVHLELIPYAQRYKARTGTTGLS